MIICKNIKKKFNDVTIFKDFSYKFEDKGLYVLYGISGSGKTTLLQILLGIVSFDDGEIAYDGNVYKKCVNYNNIQDKIAYISQDTYFIDYLTIEENLILQSNKNKDEINNLVKKFNLSRCLKKFPNQLSGGERQRFALIGNILKDKKIFLLDEPTASLDKKNRDIFYEMLDELKEKALVICASHDSTIFSLECKKIDFNDLDRYKDKDLKVDLSKKIKYKRKNSFFKETFIVLKYLCRQMFRFEKKILFLFTTIFSVVLLLLFACTDYDTKLINQLIYNNDLKATGIFCSLETKDYCNSILSNYDVSEVTYNYIRNVPMNSYEEDDDSSIQTDFVTDIITLPEHKDNLGDIDSKLLYGHYFEDKNDIIIGYEEALELQNLDESKIKNLIGEKIELNLPDGKDEFEIVGIFNKIDEDNETLWRATLGQYVYDWYYFLSNSYMEKYLQDDVLGSDELNSNYPATSLTVYFNNSKDFMSFYNKYKGKDYNSNSPIVLNDPINNFVEFGVNDELIQQLCFSTSIAFLALGLIFYYQIHKTRLAHTEHNYSIYEYYGYREMSVKTATSIYFLLYMFFIILLSSFCSILLSKVLNYTITSGGFLPYPLFMISIDWILKLLIVSGVFALIESLFLNHSRKKKGWFYLIKEKSDLL